MKEISVYCLPYVPPHEIFCSFLILPFQKHHPEHTWPDRHISYTNRGARTNIVIFLRGFT